MVLKNEELIRKGVTGQLEKEENVNAGNIRVDVSEGTVTLSGTVDCYSEKISAREAASRVLGVKQVENNLRVEYPREPVEYDDEKAKVYLMMRRLVQSGPGI